MIVLPSLNAKLEAAYQHAGLLPIGDMAMQATRTIFCGFWLDFRYLMTYNPFEHKMNRLNAFVWINRGRGVCGSLVAKCLTPGLGTYFQTVYIECQDPANLCFQPVNEGMLKS